MSVLNRTTAENFGWIYAVTAGSNLAGIKCGFTKNEDIESYIRKSYSRVLQPLNILNTMKIMNPRNPRLAESMLFTALRQYRITPNHEVFNIPSLSILREAFECVKNAYAVLENMPVNHVDTIQQEQSILEHRPTRSCVQSERIPIFASNSNEEITGGDGDGVKNFQCDHCDEFFLNKKSLDSHLNKKFPCWKTETNFACSKCDKVYTENNNRYRHQKACDGKKPKVYKDRKSTVDRLKQENDRLKAALDGANLTM